MSLLELMCTCRGMLRHSYTVCGAQARGLKGHRDSPRLAASSTASLSGITSKEVAWLFPVKNCRADRRGVISWSYGACCLT